MAPYAHYIEAVANLSVAGFFLFFYLSPARPVFHRKLWVLALVLIWLLLAAGSLRKALVQHHHLASPVTGEHIGESRGSSAGYRPSSLPRPSSSH